MEDNINIPYVELAQKCGIVNPHDTVVAMNTIDALECVYSTEQLIDIYNYFFENTNSYELLNYILDKIGKYKSILSKEVLTDSLLMQEKLLKRIPDREKITRIRVKIAKVLGKIKDSGSVYPLLYCLNNKKEHYKVKLACAESLGHLGNKYAVLPLIDVIEDETEQSVYVKESAISALGMLGDEKALDALLSILNSKSRFLSKFTFLKERALEALSKLGFCGEKVLYAIENSLRDESSQIRINAIEVLMNIGDKHSIHLIKNMLFDTNYEVVKNAVTALYNLQGKKILIEIINNINMNDNAKTAAISLKDELSEYNRESIDGE